MLVERKVSICKFERETSWAKGPLVNKRKYILQAKSKLFTQRTIISLCCRHTQRSAERDLNAYLKLTSEYIQINTENYLASQAPEKQIKKQSSCWKAAAVYSGQGLIIFTNSPSPDYEWVFSRHSSTAGLFVCLTDHVTSTCVAE